MKKLVMTVTVAAFAIGAFAGENCNKDKAACADKDKAAASCPASKAQCPTSKQDAAKAQVQSPKGKQASQS